MKKKLFLILMIVLMFFACSKNKKTADVKKHKNISENSAEVIELGEIIKYHPRDIVSLDSPIDVIFDTDIKSNMQLGSILKDTPFIFSPALDGHVKWIKKNTVRFIPDETLQMDTEYNVTIKGELLLNKKNVTDFDFSFSTPKQQVKKFNYDFITQKHAEKSLTKFVADLSFYQNVVLEDLQKDLELRLENRPIDFKITSTNAQMFHIESRQIEKKETIQYMTITLPEDYTPENEKWSKTVTVFKEGKFAVLTSLDMSENENKKQYGVRFSEELNSDMDISGFVNIEPEIDYKLMVREKYLIAIADFIPGKAYKLTISSGLPSASGKRLEKEYVKKMSFSNIKPEVKWISKGVFLPSSTNNIIQFKSVNIARIKLKVFRIYEDNVGFFVQQNSLTTSDYYSDLYRVGEEVYTKTLNIKARQNMWNTNNIDIGKILEESPNSAYIVSLYFEKEDLIYPVVNKTYELTGNQLYYEDSGYYSDPNRSGYYQEKGKTSKLIFLSDVALTVKKANKKLHVFAVDVEKAEPVANYKLNVYNYQNKLLETQKTDNDGYAVFNNDDGFTIRGDDSRGIVLLKLNGQRWETSKFDVAGATKGKSGLKTYIYLDRGVHRPGDKIFLSAIIRSDSKIPPKSQPVALKLKNPMNQIVEEQTCQIGEFGHCDFEISTAANAPTGNWKAELHFAGEVFYQWLKIETVKPNRIKVNIDIPDKVIGSPLELIGQITSKYLFGAPGADLKTEGEILISEKYLKIDGFENYSFTDPVMKFQSRRRTVFDGNLDADGEADIDYSFSKEVEQVNCLNAQLEVTVSEKGGSQVTEYKNFTVMPDSILPGIQKSDSYYLKKNEAYDFPVIVTNLDGKLIPGHKLQITHYVNQHYWWWEYHDNYDKKDFRKLENTIELESETLVSDNEPVNYNLKVEDRGLHYINVLDKTTGRSCGMKFYVSWWGRYSQEKDEKDQDFLNISFDKEKYNPGNRAKVNFESPAKGLYLMTIEQDGKLLSTKVQEVNAGMTSLSVPITEEMVPNCYLSLSLIQPHGQMANDIPIRNYGIKTIFVEDAETRLDLEIEAPETVRPKEKFSIKINNNSNQNVSATVAIVDNGLLDLTHFKTPDPWKFYFQKLRLGITTLDSYNEIIGTLLPDVDNAFTIGGGMADMAKYGGMDEIQKIKRFKAAVIFKHLPVLKPNSSNEFEFTMPDYIGSMRIMVVGCSEKGFGSAEKDMLVKTPLLVLPTIPRVIHPGDKFNIPVSVFALEDSIKDVTVKLKVSKHLSLISDASDSITFDKKGEKEILFELRAEDAIGGAKIELIAKAKRDSSVYTVDLPVSPAFPYITVATDTVLMNKGKMKFTPEKLGYENTNSAKVVFTKIPDIQLEKRLNYLIRYPYGCIEQTTSGCFSQLYLGNVMELSEARQRKSMAFIDKGISRLMLFMNSSGFSYWPGGRGNSDWCTAYLGHFLFSAKEIGYHIPNDLEKHWLKTAKRMSRDRNEDNYRYQAYILFVLAYSGNAEFGAMNLLRENYLSKMDPLSKTLLATAYFISGKEQAAHEILHNESYDIDDYRELSGTYGSRLRDQALIAYCSVLMEDNERAGKMLKVIVDRFQKYHWFSTQEISFTLLALSKFYDNTDFTKGDIPFTLKIEGEKKKEYLLDDYLLEVDLNEHWNKEIQVKSDSDNPLFVYLYESGIPKEDIVKTESKGLKLYRRFYDDEGNVVKADTLNQGQSIWVRYLVECKTLEDVDEIALSSMFPAGWEIINPRMSGESMPEWIRNVGVSGYDYMDVRDDRINWFFDMYGREKNFFIKINPTFKGEYILPPVTLEAMYSPDYYSRIKSKRVVVK